MNYKLLISPDTFKKISGSSQNIDDSRLVPIIFRAQQEYIQSATGTDLLNKLKSDYISDTLTGKYLTIYEEYIVPCLVEYTSYLANIDLTYPLTNQGMISRNGDNVDNIDLRILQYKNSAKKDSAEFWRNLLIKYLCEYSNDIPEYTQNLTGDKIQPNNRGFESSILLKGASRNKNWKNQ